MATKPKTPKAAAAAPAHRDVVITVQQRDELDDIRNLTRGILLAIDGIDVGDFERSGLLSVANAVLKRISELIDEFNAFAEGKAA
jgi:hypothetical protein